MKKQKILPIILAVWPYLILLLPLMKGDILMKLFVYGYMAGTAVPLRYNYDKPEKPRISRVFGYQARFFILFQPEKSSREVVIS